MKEGLGLFWTVNFNITMNRDYQPRNKLLLQSPPFKLNWNVSIETKQKLAEEKFDDDKDHSATMTSFMLGRGFET